MTRFDPQDPDFEASVRRSFDGLTLMRTVGARLLSVAPGEVEIDLRSERISPSITASSQPPFSRRLLM